LVRKERHSEEKRDFSHRGDGPLRVALVACAGKTVGTASPPIAAATQTPPPVQSPTIIIPSPEPINTLVSGATGTPTPSPTAITVAPKSNPKVFAAFREAPVDSSPAIYHKPVAPDLVNVVIPFALSAEQRARLARDGVVVMPNCPPTIISRTRQDANSSLPTSSDSQGFPDRDTCCQNSNSSGWSLGDGFVRRSEEQSDF
jgi:hypothetical protein